MATIQGPLHSDDASGTLGDQVTFARWKGRRYARQYAKPTNPKSALQTGVRVMMGWLARAWASVLTDNNRASWATLAESNQVSPFNAYMTHNLNRWDDSDTFVPDPSTAPAAYSNTTEITGLAVVGNHVELEITPEDPIAVGLLIYRSTIDEFTPSRANLIGVVDAVSDDPVSFTDGPLASGTYYYRSFSFDATGVIDTGGQQQSAVIP